MNQALELFAASAANKKERLPFRAAAIYQNSKSFLIELSFSNFKSPNSIKEFYGRFEVMFIERKLNNKRKPLYQVLCLHNVDGLVPFGAAGHFEFDRLTLL